MMSESAIADTTAPPSPCTARAPTSSACERSLLFGDGFEGGKGGLEVPADHAVHAEKDARQLRDEAGRAVHGPGNLRGIAFAVQGELGDVVAFERRDEVQLDHDRRRR